MELNWLNFMLTLIHTVEVEHKKIKYLLSISIISIQSSDL
ncbi:uncharacterized protein METZ01_LOCUS165743 [marine metagenome]|uniref:Uncharacterized protein n=1 Tax=marine metagenome TaxID=408172 RepID=A0A382BH02_9ZZZZ